jgi:hypothetical protein
MAANGEHKKFDLDIPPDVDPHMRSSLDGMSSQLTKITVPFPTEPVGIGARWKTRASAKLNGVRAEVTTVYTLRERTDNQYRTEVSFEQSAPHQDAVIPNLPAGYRAHVDGMTISGSGETSGSLSTIFPLNSSIQAGGTIDMRVGDGQNSQNMRQTIHMTMGLEPAQ